MAVQITQTRVSPAGPWQHDPSAPSLRRPPPLESGDRLTRLEFERRYGAMPDVKKAELIEGVVYVSSPLKFEEHAEPHGSLIVVLGTYKAATPGARLGDNATLRLDADNELQPDALLLVDLLSRGNARLTSDGYLEGAPELIAEIAASSASNDLRDKFRAYRRNGVQEYMVWQVYDARFDWWELRDGEYVPLPVDNAGVIRSRVFPGLWLNVPALLNGDLATVLTTLQQGLQSEEHITFAQKLAAQ